jgi:hypothetical protein
MLTTYWFSFRSVGKEKSRVRAATQEESSYLHYSNWHRSLRTRCALTHTLCGHERRELLVGGRHGFNPEVHRRRGDAGTTEDARQHIHIPAVSQERVWRSVCGENRTPVIPSFRPSTRISLPMFTVETCVSFFVPDNSQVFDRT